MTEERLDDLLRSMEYTLAARRRSPATIDQYQRSLIRFYQWLDARGEIDISAVTPGVVEEWMTSLQRTVVGKGADGLPKLMAPSTVRYNYAGLRGFYKWHSRREGYVTPFAAVESPSVPETRKDVVSTRDMKRVLDYLRAAGRLRDVALVGLLYDTGMRASEVCGVKTTDIVWANARQKQDVSFIKLEDTKNGETRDVPISYAAGEMLDLWLSKRKDKGNDWLFPNLRTGRPLTRSGLLQVVKEAFEDIGLKGIGPHDLRHTFATHFLDGDSAKVGDLMAIGGWRSEQMARHYTKDGKQRRAMKSHRENSPLSRLG